MDYSRLPTTSNVSQITSRVGKHFLTTLLLILVVLVGLYFRTLNLSEWDGRTGHHPDERFMHYTVVNLRVPQDWRTYFVSTCPDPVPEPRNPGSPANEWEPSERSGCSTLNPRNFVTWSGGYVYGTLPTTLTRLVVEATERTETHQILVVGRALSAGADLITLLALFFLAHMLYGRWVALLAAALYAGAVMPIQQSHYFTVDQFAVCFGTLALLFTARLAQRALWRDAILAGVFIAAATASKINMAALVGLVFVALGSVAWRTLYPATPHPLTATKRTVTGMVRIVTLLAVTGIVAFAAFRVFQPDAFTGPNIWNIGLEERFKERLGEARLTANGTIDLPSSHQWAGRTPWVFPWTNMVLWGMGLPLGLAGWMAWVGAGWQLVTRRKLVHLVPWMWVAVYFAWQGQQFVTTMRYFLPIYPPLIIFAAWGLVASATYLRGRAADLTARPAFFARYLTPSRLRVARIGLIVGVLAATWSWAWSYTRIYTRPYTRVVAAEWFEQNAAPTALNTWELWDDPLPRPGDLQLTTHPYAEEELLKYIGGDPLQLNDTSSEALIAQLTKADYVVLSSPRVYGSVERVPQRFPAILRYYQALFDGSLGFELAADIHSFPTLFGLPLNDQAAEEAFWVYDHPRVLIFRRTEAFSPERARQVITEGIVWDEVYRGLRPAQINKAPTALQLTDAAWQKLQSSDTSYLFRSPLHPALTLLAWILAIEALGLAALGLLWPLRLPLRDRGLSLAPMIGLLLFALIPALLGAALEIAVTRTMLLLWFAGLLLSGFTLIGRARSDIWAFVRNNRRTVLLPRLLYVAVFAAGLALLWWTRVISNEALVRWTALVRSPTLPPYDPLLAGGLDPLPYSAQLPFALLDRMLGIQPTTALQFALPAALALAVQALWSTVYNSRVVRVGSWQRQQWAATIGALLLLFPGLSFAGIGQFNVWQALTTGALDTLGLATLTTTALGLGLMLLRSWGEQPQWLAQTLIVLPLIFLRSYGIALLLVVWFIIGLLCAAGLHGDWRRWLLRCVPLLVATLLLSHSFSWSVASPALQPAPVELTSAALLLGLLGPLALLALWSAIVAPLLADQWILLTVAGIVLGWILVAAVMRFPSALLVVPAMMALTWLAVQAWIPGWGTRRWRTGIIPATAALSLGLLVLVSLAMLGRIPSNPQHLFVVAAVSLVCVAGWTLPALSSMGKSATQTTTTRPLIGLGLGVLALLMVVMTISNVRAATLATEATVGSTRSGDITAAARWLADASSASTVVVMAPQRTPPALIAESGTSTLITAVDDERRRRDVVQPAVNGVIDGRLRAIDAIYGGNVAEARDAIQSYQVGYVLLGQTEREVYGGNAGAALEVLAERGNLELAFNQGEIQLYKASPPDRTPPYVLATTKLELPVAKDLLLDQPVSSLPVVDEFGWNSLATRYQLFGVLLWLLLLEVLGLLAYPLVSRIFHRWPDRGWGLTKLVGLLVWGYAVWMPVNLEWWLFNWQSLVFGGTVLAMLAVWMLQLRKHRTDYEMAARPAGKSILRSEFVFLATFGLWTLIRAANPDLWHPYYGGEKPFEFGFLNAILRSPVLPPYDPFFSDGIVNYYYYGLFLVGLPIKAVGIDSAIGFNLALATLFALTCSGAFTVGHQLTGRARYGLVAVLLLVGIGSVASVVEVTESRGLKPVVAALEGGIQGFGDRIGAWFWGPSRVIPNTINEFPLFGFLFADLHPHLIALPITLLAVACATELARRRQISRATFGLSALVLGTLAVANSWDAPTYALLIGGAIVGRMWRHRQGSSIVRAFVRALQGALLALVVTLAGLALFTPFFLHYRAMVGGIGRTRWGDTLLQYGLIYGPLLWLALTLLGCLLWWAARRADATWRVAVRRSAISLPLLLAVLLLSGAALQNQSELPSGWPLRLMLGLLGALGVGLALVVRLRDREWMALWLVTVGILVGLGTQFVFVRDHLAGGDWERMNTVFKFGFQQWSLWAIGGAAAIPLIFKRLRRYEISTGIWLGLLIMLILPGLVYPLVAIPSRLSTRFTTSLPLTLDGLAFMDHAQYTVERDSVVEQIDLRADAEAIRWIKQNIAGTPIVATSEAEFYRRYGVRIAANTGLPTILGRLHEDEQRPASDVLKRERDVQDLFNTTDPVLAAQILAKYRVDYLYIGPVEQALYEAAGLAKFEAMRNGTLDLVYENDSVRIYRVKAETLTGIAQVVQAPPVAFQDAQLAALQAQVAANPQDSGAAFGLGQRLAELNRVDEAVAVLEQAAAIHPQDVPLHHLLGDLLAQLGRADSAIAAWQQAADVEPTASNINKLGQGLVRLGRWDEAERVLQQALAVDPSFADPYIYLGELYRARNGSGDKERAITAFRRYLELAPADGPWRSIAETQLRELGQ